MKTLRILATIPLTLISLMNVGYPFGADPDPEPVLAAAIVVMGLAGFVAGYGLVRNTSWGLPAALAIAGVNVAAAIVALVVDAEGAAIGLVVSSVALVLCFAAGSARRTMATA